MKRKKFAYFFMGIMLAGIMAMASGCSDSKQEEPARQEVKAKPLPSRQKKEKKSKKDQKDQPALSVEATDVQDLVEGENPEEAGEPKESVTKTITITATGDCTLGNTQDQSYDGSFNAYYDNHGAEYFFDDVRSIFEADDMTLVNLECVLSTATGRVEKTFNLKGDPEHVKIMTTSSVEACSLGNNHTFDYGQEGFDETKSVLDEAGLVYAYTEQEGVFETEDGTRIGVVSSSLLSENSEKTDALKAEMQKLREEGAELIIACCHWGIEKEYYPNDYQKKTAHELIDAGADLVIGNHPHVLQGVEIYNGKVICYSLGNFCFGGNKNPGDKNTMIYQQTFTITDGEVQTDDLDARIIPCRLSSTSEYNDYQPTIAEGDRKSSIIENVNEYSAALGSVSFDSDGILKAE